MTSPVGVGIIGAGVISDQYLENLTTFPDLRVLFVADLDLDRARGQAERYKVPGHGSVDELLSHPGIEIVVNLTLPAVHVDVAGRVLEAGKHVFTEKPFSLDRESGAALLADASARGLRVATAPDTFLGPGLQCGKRLIESGAIGTPLTALVLFQTGGPESWHPNADFLYAPGAGPLFDMGPYYLTALVQNFGPVRRVSATGSISHATRVIGSGPRKGEEFAVGVPTHVSALLEFIDGGSAQCVFSFQSTVRRTGVVEIAGTQGTIELPDPNTFGGDVVLHTESSDPVTVHSVADAGRGTGVVELARAIRAGVPERASGEQAFHIVDVMESILEAAESGEWVAVTSTVARAQSLPEGWDPREATL